MAAILNPTALTAHAELAETFLGHPGSTAPWNRADALDREPAGRHLHLVSDHRGSAAVPEATARGRVTTVLSGLALAFLVALAAIGLLQFLGADAAASTPASTTDITTPVGAAVPEASAPPEVVANPGPVEMVVQSGDSLWTVARRLQPHGDVRRLVDRLIERNGGIAVTVGQHLDVRGLLD
jgi:hypothetical protein